MTKKKLILAVLLGATLGSTSAMQQNPHNDTPIPGAEWVASHSLLACENSYMHSAEYNEQPAEQTKKLIDFFIKTGAISADTTYANADLLRRVFNFPENQSTAIFEYLKKRDHDLREAASKLPRGVFVKTFFSTKKTYRSNMRNKHMSRRVMRESHNIGALNALAGEFSVDFDIVHHMYHSIYNSLEANSICLKHAKTAVAKKSLTKNSKLAILQTGVCSQLNKDAINSKKQKAIRFKKQRQISSVEQSDSF